MGTCAAIFTSMLIIMISIGLEWKRPCDMKMSSFCFQNSDFLLTNSIMSDLKDYIALEVICILDYVIRKVHIYRTVPFVILMFLRKICLMKSTRNPFHEKFWQYCTVQKVMGQVIHFLIIFVLRWHRRNTEKGKLRPIDSF